MTKLHGAVLYNVIGIVTILAYHDHLRNTALTEEDRDLGVWLVIIKGFCGLIISGLYYYEVFHVWTSIFITFFCWKQLKTKIPLPLFIRSAASQKNYNYHTIFIQVNITHTYYIKQQ